MPTNRTRADRVTNFVLTYKERHDKGEDYETVLSDMLTDLFHFAVERNVDWNQVLERSVMHLEAELQGEE